MDRDALRKFRQDRETKAANRKKFVEVDYLSPKVGKPIRFKLLNWSDAESQLFFHMLQLHWVAAGGKNYPLKSDPSNAISQVYANLRKSKNPRLQQLAGKIKPNDTALVHVIDMEDYQPKVLMIDGDGIDAIAEQYLNVTDVDVTDLNNQIVFEVLKELESYTIKGGQSRNRRKYTVTLVEDENFVLTPKARAALDELADLSTLYTVPDADFAETVITTFLAENDLEPSDFLTEATTTVEEEEQTETLTEAAKPLPAGKLNTASSKPTVSSGFPKATPLNGSAKTTVANAKPATNGLKTTTAAKTATPAIKTTVAPAAIKKVASKATTKPAAEPLTSDDAYSDIDDFLKEGVE